MNGLTRALLSAVILVITASAAGAASNCRFSGKGGTLGFGLLDPLNPVNVTATTSVVFTCVGSDAVVFFTVSDDDGMYEAGPDLNRMNNVTFPGQYLPYTLSVSPQSGVVPRKTDVVLTITGSLTGADYQDAYMGIYTDTVILSILP